MLLLLGGPVLHCDEFHMIDLELAQYKDRWRALVGTVRKLRIPKMRGIS